MLHYVTDDIWVVDYRDKVGPCYLRSNIQFNFLHAIIVHFFSKSLVCSSQYSVLPWTKLSTCLQRLMTLFPSNVLSTYLLKLDHNRGFTLTQIWNVSVLLLLLFLKSSDGCIKIRRNPKKKRKCMLIFLNTNK